MRVIPRNQAPQISTCRILANKWAEHAAELGLDPLEIAELQGRVEAARVAFNAQRVAHAQAQTATVRLSNALDAMTTLTAAMVKQVRARAMTQGNGIYPLSYVPIPRKRSKLASPGTPDEFAADLQQSGWLALRWACKNPRGAVGTIYHVSRQVHYADGSVGAKEHLGIAGKKAYVDATLPLGCASAVYYVQAIRSTSAGSEANHTVNFSSHFRAGAPARLQLAA